MQSRSTPPWMQHIERIKQHLGQLTAAVKRKLPKEVLLQHGQVCQGKEISCPWREVVLDYEEARFLADLEEVAIYLDSAVIREWGRLREKEQMALKPRSAGEEGITLQ